MAKKTRKYQDILKTASDLFFRYGMRRVTIEEICVEAKVSKMTFYKYFPGKTALIKTMLDEYYDYWIDKCREVMYADIPFSEKLHQFLELKMESTRNSSKEFILDIYKNPPDDEIRQYVEKYKARSMADTISLFNYAREQNWLRHGIKPELLMLLMNKITEMIQDENLYRLYGTLPELTRAVTSFFLYGISSNGPEENIVPE